MSQAESRPSLEQDLEAEMQASVARMLAKERAAGGTGRATALALQQHKGDWRQAEVQLERMLAHGPLPVEL
jgi:hypothetical protein